MLTSWSPAGRVPKSPTTVVREWDKYLALHLKRMRQSKKVTTSDRLRLAGFLALLGPRGSESTLEPFWVLTALLLSPKQIHRLKVVLPILPADPQALQRLVSCYQAWARVTRRSVDREKYKAEEVLRVMLQIPEPEPYVRHLHSRGLSALGGVFHPNTLDQAKKDLRGIFTQSSGDQGYWALTQGQLKIVKDDE